MMQYFEIRNAPAPDGEVIALWKKEKSNYHLEIIGEEPWMSGDINRVLINETTEEAFSVMDAICEIPHIQSDGVYHFLGELTFEHAAHSVGHRVFPSSDNDEKTFTTKVYAVVVDLDNLQDTNRFVVEEEEFQDVVMAEECENPYNI